MSTQTLTFLIGPPLSGKTTYAKSHPESVVVSSDAKREELGFSGQDSSVNYSIFKACKKDLYKALAEGENVIFDATNLSRKERKRDVNRIRELFPKLQINAVVFNVDLATLKERRLSRKPEDVNYIPEEALEKKYEKFINNFPSKEVFDNITFWESKPSLNSQISEAISDCAESKHGEENVINKENDLWR